MTGLNMTRLDSLTGGMTSIMHSLISDQKKIVTEANIINMSLNAET